MSDACITNRSDALNVLFHNPVGQWISDRYPVTWLFLNKRARSHRKGFSEPYRLILHTIVHVSLAISSVVQRISKGYLIQKIVGHHISHECIMRHHKCKIREWWQIHVPKQKDQQLVNIKLEKGLLKMLSWMLPVKSALQEMSACGLELQKRK